MREALTLVLVMAGIALVFGFIAIVSPAPNAQATRCPPGTVYVNSQSMQRPVCLTGEYVR